jgi:hypothetical protein
MRGSDRREGASTRQLDQIQTKAVARRRRSGPRSYAHQLKRELDQRTDPARDAIAHLQSVLHDHTAPDARRDAAALALLRQLQPRFKPIEHVVAQYEYDLTQLSLEELKTFTRLAEKIRKKKSPS